MPHRVRVFVWLILVWTGVACGAPTLSSVDWQAYKGRYVTPEGRVVDYASGEISHSEGQGYGLLLSIAAEDRITFEAIWNWTQKNLQRDDKLFAWRWYPDRVPAVPDWNNATDGDLLIAWALASAGKRWKKEEWRKMAATIAARIRTTLIVQTPFGPALLPAQYGFQEQGRLLLNPSYWVFPALKAIQQVDPDPAWPALEESGQKLIALTRFGSYHLPPDWVTLYPDARIGLPNEPQRRRFSYDAIRVPMYLCWAGIPEPVLMQNLLNAWPSEFAPAWFDLATDERAAYPLGLAQRAIRNMLPGCKKPFHTPTLNIDPASYYDSTLVLLSKIALAVSMGKSDDAL